MPCGVDTTITISTGDLDLLSSLRRALGPDNREVAPNMSIEELLETDGEKPSYSIRIKVRGNTADSLKRARSSVDEILAIVDLLLKVKSRCFKGKEPSGQLI
ncbi:MAG: hypothetical protein QXK88_05945 [Desulfurococcaceae archaeon]